MSRPKVLALVSFFPQPEDRGDPVRVMAALRSLDSSSDLTVLAVRRATTSADDVAALRDSLRGRVVAVPLPEHNRATRWTTAVRQGVPPWILSRTSPDTVRFIDEHSGEFDRIVALGEASASALLQSRPAVPWHWDKANVLSRSSVQDIAEAPDPVRRARARLIHRLSVAYEQRLVPAAATISVTSAEEGRRLAETFAREPDVVIPSSVELPARISDRRDGRSVVWLGSLDYTSNLAGLRLFVAEGLPLLRDAGLTLRIIGSGGAPGVVDELRREPGIEFAGYQPDLGAALAEARFAVVPLWSGAGIKLKTLTLLAHGLTVAGTPVAFEGIPEPDRVALVAENPRSLAEALLGCAPEQADELARNATRLVSEHFSHDVTREQFRRLSHGLAHR
jgi:glycosyltransferase involved in cell wall biosynthesis